VLYVDNFKFFLQYAVVMALMVLTALGGGIAAYIRRDDVCCLLCMCVCACACVCVCVGVGQALYVCGWSSKYQYSSTMLLNKNTILVWRPVLEYFLIISKKCPENFSIISCFLNVSQNFFNIFLIISYSLKISHSITKYLSSIYTMFYENTYAFTNEFF